MAEESQQFPMNPEFARMVAEQILKMAPEVVAEGLRHIADQISAPRLPPKKIEAAPRSEKKPWPDVDDPKEKPAPSAPTPTTEGSAISPSERTERRNRVRRFLAEHAVKKPG